MTSQNSRAASRRRGFTLVELMLVVVIVGIASAVALPRFVQSFQGAQLRSAARSVAMASRFARSSAVLHQKDMALIFYPHRNEIEMVSISRMAGERDRARFLDARDERAVAGLLDETETSPSVPRAGQPPPQIESELVRELPQTVRVLEVQVHGEVQDIEGGYVANFFANGMCDDFKLFLVDDRERLASIAVDPLSGKVTVAFE